MSEPDRGDVRVLHVDDEQAFADRVAAYLEQERGGFTVEPATSVEEALSVLEDQPVDCVVSDYDLPGESGLDLLRTVRERNGDLPFVLFTGAGSEAVASEAISAGVDDYLRKGDGSDRYALLADRLAALVRRRFATGAGTPDDRELLERAVDVLDDAFYVLDDGGSLAVWNDRVEELTGNTGDELDGADPTAFFTDADAETVQASIEDVLSTGRAVLEADLETPDGTVPFELRGHRLTDGHGEVVGLAGIGRDVSERRRRERSLRALNEFATDIAEYTDPELVCERAVTAAEDVLAFDLSAVTISSDDRLSVVATSTGVPEDGVADMAVDEGLVGRTYREGRPFVVDDLRAHPDAEPQGPYRSAVSVPIGDHGVFQAVDEEPGSFGESDRELAELLAAHCSSVLDRMERETTLQEQNERLEEFASLVSHDLRNPLTVMQTSVDLARETGDDEHLEDCERAIHRMDDLVEDLLTLAREGHDVETDDDVAVDDLVRESWDAIAPPPATLTVVDPGTLSADPDRLRQAIDNLLRNAVEHGGDDVGVEVGALPDGAGFYVADDGPGIQVEGTDRVFEPGFTTSDDGTGFGLRIVREVVEAHGWTVEVTDGEAGGARFEIQTG